ncbi:MAG TPA: M20/M25/M40 family metallo-hydrolase [Thermoleophilia bacterium]|nr:M20/M25/M40 family metallo-hydrolase [Thermoleophilia bacterium]
MTVARYGLSESEWQALEDEVLELFTALLRVDTTNGNETEAALVVQAYLAENGIPGELDGELPDRKSLVARLDGARPGATLTMMGHLDVVPADAGEWSVPPFAGVVKDGYVWGLGAVDMKNQVAAEAVALARLKRAGASFSGTVKYAATADEEVGEHCGVRWLCEHRPEALRADYLVNEGMGGLWLPVDGHKVFLLAVGEKAFAQFRIRTRGRGGHGSVPEKERSAVLDLARAVIALGVADPPAIVSGTTARFIDALVPDRELAARLKDPATARVAGAELRRLDPVVAGLVEPLFGATLTPTVLAAGKAVNVIPTRAEACVDCRILPEMAQADVREYVTTVLDPLGIEWEFEWVDVTTPNASPASTPLSESIERVLRRDVPDAVLAPMTSSSFTDSRWVREAFPDCVAYGFAPFLAESFHAMDGGRDHEPDERILVEDVVYQALFFERLAGDLLA